MKSARELFRELGYRYSEDNYFISYIGSENIAPVQYKIVFSKEYKSIELMPTVNGKTHYFTRVDMKLLQAINKQIEELYWNDTIINLNVKLDGKKVMEAMRGGNRKEVNENGVMD